MADFVILGDYPDFHDPQKQYKCGHGKYMWHLFLSNEGAPRDVAVEFLYNSYADMQKGFTRMHAIDAKHKPKVYLAMGAKATEELGVSGTLKKIRGSVYTLEKKRGPVYVVPTFNPRVYKSPYKVFAEEPIEKGLLASHDMARAITAYNEGWEPLEENFNIEPTIEEFRAFVKESVESQALLGSDIEGTGLNIEHNQIVCIGFAKSETECFVLPLLKEKGEHYWPPEHQQEVKDLLNTLFHECSFIWQNGYGYDIPSLIKSGYTYPLSSYTDETMILHHTISPELPHNIGFQSSQYGKQTYWKESFIDRKEHIFDTNQKEMKIYNARDCIALHQIRNNMLAHIDRLVESSEHYRYLHTVYSDGMAQARVICRMFQKGVLKDNGKLKVWQKFAKENLDTNFKAMMDLIEVPESFSFTSDQEVRLLIYNERPAKLDNSNWKEDLRTYEAVPYNYQYECTECGRKVTKKFYDYEEVPPSLDRNCPKCKKVQPCKRTEKERTSIKCKSKDTNAYRKLKAYEALESVKPLYQLRGYKPLQTDGGESALDKAAIVRYTIAITMRLDKLATMKRRRPVHDVEQKGLEDTIKFLNAYSQWSKFQKMVTSFYDFDTWSDGRVRTTLLPAGTSTGRLASKSPNLQNQPGGDIGKVLRAVFRAAPGNELMSADFTGLEVWIAAYFMEDPVLQKMLQDGANFHDENTKIFFGIDKDHEKWGVLRKVAKTLAFARLFYRGSDRGIYTKVMAAEPDCGLTFKDFCQAVQNWLDAHPKFAEVSRELEILAAEKRIALTAGGRVRILQGALNQIKRQAVNTPIQGSAAEVVRDDMVEIDRRFTEEGLEAEIVLQVHDELIFEYPVHEREAVAKIVYEVMTREREIKGSKFHLQIDAEVGTFWGEMDSIDLQTLEVAEGSKH